MFIRKKRIKKNEYAYLVKNKWKKKGKKGQSRQKNLKYLGRVYYLGESNNNNFEIDISKEYKENIINLLKSHLLNVGFSKIDNNTFIIIKDGNKITVKLKDHKVYSDKKKPVVLELNEGFLCNYTLKKILQLKYEGEKSEEFGYKLANLMLSVGLKPTQEQFVKIVDYAINKYNEERKKLIEDVFKNKNDESKI